jgi:hypothetical protein
MVEQLLQRWETAGRLSRFRVLSSTSPPGPAASPFSAARTNLALFIHRAVRPLTPRGVVTRCGRLVKSRVSARQGWAGEKVAQGDATRKRARAGTPRKSQEATIHLLEHGNERAGKEHPKCSFTRARLD